MWKRKPQWECARPAPLPPVVKSSCKDEPVPGSQQQQNPELSSRLHADCCRRARPLEGEHAGFGMGVRRSRVPLQFQLAGLSVWESGCWSSETSQGLVPKPEHPSIPKPRPPFPRRGPEA